MDRRLYPSNWRAIALLTKGLADWTCQHCGKQCRRTGEPLHEFIERVRPPVTVATTYHRWNANAISNAKDLDNSTFWRIPTMPRYKKNQSPWVKTNDILFELSITKAHLYRLRNELFKKGIHWKNVALPSSLRPSYRWHLPAINRLFSQGEGGDQDSGRSP